MNVVLFQESGTKRVNLTVFRKETGILKHYSYEYCYLMGGFGGAHVV
jgi:hypothetical protein